MTLASNLTAHSNVFVWLLVPVLNVLITYGQEIGINVGRGSNVVTAEGEGCFGEATVTGSSVSGHYSCTGITAYDQATGKMGKVDITVRFTAKS